MRRTSLARFVLFGAAGFGIGGTIAWPIGYYFLIELMIPIAGGLGGASLGLALRDRRKLVVLALLGALGTFLGLLVAAILYSYVGTYDVNYSLVVTGPVFGTVLGASLGLAFLDLRRIVALALAGVAGFGVGVPAGEFLGPLVDSFEDIPFFENAPFIFIAGVTGGAALGAALGYLERREPAGRRVV